MGFGFAKMFVIAIAISIILSIGTKNVWNGIVFMLGFVAIKSIWRLATG